MLWCFFSCPLLSCWGLSLGELNQNLESRKAQLIHSIDISHLGHRMGWDGVESGTEGNRKTVQHMEWTLASCTFYSFLRLERPSL